MLLCAFVLGVAGCGAERALGGRSGAAGSAAGSSAGADGAGNGATGNQAGGGATGGVTSGAGGGVFDAGQPEVGGAGGPAGGSGSAGAGGDAGSGVGTGGAGGASAPPGGVPWDPWPAVDAAPADTCRVSTFLGGDSAGAPTLSSTEVWEHDAATRVLTRRRAATGSIPASLRYVRFDGQGRRELDYRSDGANECVEWTRDSFGNSSSYFYAVLAGGPFDPTTSYPDGRTGKREATNYDLRYDGAGLLTSAGVPFPGRGGVLTFDRDDRGRCSLVKWGARGETIDQPAIRETTSWTYLNDRLAAQITTATDDPADVRCEVSFSYDAKGTLAATVVDGYADIPQPWPIVKPPRDGVADYVVRTLEQPDGSRWLEAIDFARTTTNARVLRDDIATPAFRWRWHLSAGCGALALPRHTSQDCEFERPFNLLPLGWDNPYQTPIRLF